MKQTLGSWEPYTRSILRIILAFLFSLQGYRLVYGMFPQLARRGGVGRMPLDGLPQFTGYIAIVGGALLFLGLLTQVRALVLALQFWRPWAAESGVSISRSRSGATLWGFRVDTLDESRGVGVGPIGMQLLQIGADSFAGVIRRHAFPLERESSCAYFRDQLVFLSH